MSKNWLDPEYIHRRMLREIDVGNTETANLIAALSSEVARLRPQVEAATAWLEIEDEGANWHSSEAMYRNAAVEAGAAREAFRKTIKRLK